MPDHRVFQWLHGQLHETRSFHVTRHDDGRRRAIRNSTLEGSILKIAAYRPEHWRIYLGAGPESSSRAVAQYISMSHQTVCRVLNGNRLHLLYFQRIQALTPADYLLRLTVGDIAMCAAAVLHSSCAEKL
ncbi:hypothetical protein TNCV_1871571 [Trichonephila clavipes]|nr:hypothetical protein TNCV_1871571 [Trichonephila clavipes]